MYDTVTEPSTRKKPEPGLDIYSMKDLNDRKETLEGEINDIESKIEILGKEKDSVKHMAGRLKKQKVFDKKAMEKLKPEYEVMVGHSDNFDRYLFLKGQNEKTTKSNGRLINEEIAERRERRNQMLKEKEEEYKGELDQNVTNSLIIRQLEA